MGYRCKAREWPLTLLTNLCSRCKSIVGQRFLEASDGKTHCLSFCSSLAIGQDVADFIWLLFQYQIQVVRKLLDVLKRGATAKLLEAAEKLTPQISAN